VLIVAVNSDASIWRLKDPERPVNRIQDRMAVLAALSWAHRLSGGTAAALARGQTALRD
jgi:bifunctional ADP-heptose synthase (sugar kinase/adenylyltransferase)